MTVNQPTRQILWDKRRLRRPHEQVDKARRVRWMFDRIAPTYELINTLFSGGRDRAWRQRAVAMARPGRTDRVLDIACGTGDLARAFGAGIDAPHTIVGCDFASRMLVRAVACDRRGVRWIQADALKLPFPAESFTIVGCAFGVRNFDDLDASLRGIHRVLAPGGRVVILEFTRPGHPLWRRIYEFYAGRVMPLGATLISGDRSGAYRYLPRSVLSFPDAANLCLRLEQAGFGAVTVVPMTFGIVTIYLAHKKHHGAPNSQS